MKLNRILAAGFLGIALFAASTADACTNFLFTKGATRDGSTMITYAADSHTLYGELYYRKAATYPAGTMFQVVDWDTGTKLIQIPQVAQTYSVVGNMNEHQLAIGETTYGGREELAKEIEGGIDYGSLIYLTLQRARNAREAIQVLAGFMKDYPYHSEGESFSICDPNEVWILELIGKRPGTVKPELAKKLKYKYTDGAVWVARRIPDGYVSGHANQARITQFPQEPKKFQKAKGKGLHSVISSKHLDYLFEPEVECVYSSEVITYARACGYLQRHARLRRPHLRHVQPRGQRHAALREICHGRRQRRAPTPLGQARPQDRRARGHEPHARPLRGHRHGHDQGPRRRPLPVPLPLASHGL